jgi:PAS domain-containing protein
MFSRLRLALASLVFLKEEEARYTARFVACLLPVSIALMVLLIVLPLMAGDFVQRLEVGGPVVLAWTTSWWLLRRGKVRLASLIFITGTWAVATYAVFTRDGVRAPAYLVYLTLIVYAAFLVTPAAALAVFAAALLVGLGAVVAALAGVLPFSSVVHTPATLYASYSASMLMIVLIVLVIAAEYRDAFGKLREGEAKYRTLFEMLPAAVVLHQGRRVVLANPASLSIFRTPDLGSVIGGTSPSTSPRKRESRSRSASGPGNVAARRRRTTTSRRCGGRTARSCRPRYSRPTPSIRAVPRHRQWYSTSPNRCGCKRPCASPKLASARSSRLWMTSSWCSMLTGAAWRLPPRS